MARPPLKLIEWEDAYNGNHSWHTVSSIPDVIPPYLVTTVGYEVRRDDKRVTLAMSYGPGSDGDEPVACDLFTIPVGMIRKERTLR